MVKYLYIDDEGDSQKIDGFRLDQKLDFETEQHCDNWEQQIKHLRLKADDLDGLLLDLRLDDTPNANQKKASYRGTALAQEIRTLQKEKSLKHFPIVLFSANDKVSLDNTGKDLFDLCIEKDAVNVESFPIYANELFALAEGYRFLSENAQINAYLGVETDELDSSFVQELKTREGEPVHILSKFIVDELLMKQGLLIDESVLAARLGIDKRSQDWSSLLELLKPEASYQGVFHEGWPRWWMHRIQKWWESFAPENVYLRSTSASERVRIIKEKTGLPNLVPVARIDKSRSEEYWTICKGYNRPLDPLDGLLIIGQDNLYSWQEPEYVSVDAALNRSNKTQWKDIAEIEQDHFNALKKIYSKKGR